MQKYIKFIFILKKLPVLLNKKRITDSAAVCLLPEK